MPAESASDAARALIRHRWDRVTDPAERTAATAKAVAAHVAAGQERRVLKAIDALVATMIEDPTRN